MAAQPPPLLRAVPEKEAKRHSVHEAYEGHKVVGADGKKLGEIKDLLIEPSSGQIAYAVVSSGGVAGFHETLRLVPFRALEPADRRHGEFMLSLRAEDWRDASIFNEDDFKADRITISDEQNRRLAQRFDRAKSGSAATGSAYYTANNSQSLVRASQLRGKPVQADGQRVGSIKELIVKADAAEAVALFRPATRWFETKSHYEVALSRFSFGDIHRDEASTNLTLADFQPQNAVAQTQNKANPPAPKNTVAASTEKAPATPQAASKPPANSASTTPAATKPGNEPALTPTGKTSAEQAPPVNPRPRS